MTRKLSSLFVLAAPVAAALLIFNGVAPIPEAFAQALPGGGSTASGANIRETRHNLSSGARDRKITSQNDFTTEKVLKSTSTAEVCVFCHTPHAATTGLDRPLWNRGFSTQTYTPYASSSLDATDLDVADLGTPSKLCLSCHDGSIAVGNVSNNPGPGAGSQITFSATDFGSTTPTMPSGRNQSNADHGFTRRLGTDLRNDHPISFTFDSTLATADGELRNPSGSSAPTKIANRVAGSPKPDFPLKDGKVQCTTCHDPHRNTQKFLLKNRLAQGTPATQGWGSDWSFNDATDQICLGCHTRLGRAWQQSAHADSNVADETYVNGDAAMRDFPTGTQVWQAGCLNCHDTHTVAGSRRLLREGVNTTTTSVTVGGIGYAATFRAGVTSADDYNTTSAVENTCYQCHSSSPAINAGTLSTTNGVPNIQAEFGRTYRMPITNNDQGDPFFSNTTEVHDITNADAIESQTNLGYGTPENRHVECSDCHNPHRVVKADTFLGNNLEDAIATANRNRRTHIPARGTTGSQGNIASGALRGAWGVEPSYTAASQTTVTTTSIWPEFPTFTVKQGDPGNASTLPTGAAGTNTAGYLTREYQLCFKCHSNYANGPTKTDFPQLKSSNARGTTASGTNGMTRYTNVAAEFAARAEDPPKSGLDQGEVSNSGTACNGGDCAPVGSYPGDLGNLVVNAVNHRSWHPVVFPTGRTPTERGSASFDNIKAPFNDPAKIGLQTMHCSDCHGHSTSWTDGSGPDLGQVQGPHGSDSPFILKGVWSTAVNFASGAGFNSSLCANCHSNTTTTQSGFAGDHIPNDNMNTSSVTTCMRCHIAVPHGWKNKAFLVNKGCVGTEGGEASNCVNRTAWTVNFNAPPYYNTARLSFRQWRPSRDSNYTNETATCAANTSDFKDPNGREMKDCQ